MKEELISLLVDKITKVYQKQVAAKTAMISNSWNDTFAFTYSLDYFVLEDQLKELNTILSYVQDANQKNFKSYLMNLITHYCEQIYRKAKPEQSSSLARELIKERDFLARKEMINFCKYAIRKLYDVEVRQVTISI